METTIREAIVDILAETEVGQRAIAENKEFLLTKRKSLAQEIAVIREQQAHELPPLRQNAEEAKIAREVALEQHQKAEHFAAEKWQAAFGRSVELSSAIDRRLSELQATADPAIQRLIDEVLSRLESNRHTLLRVDEHRHSRNIFTGRRKLTITSNARSVEAWMTALRQAIKDLQALKLEAVDDLPGRLKIIRDSIREADKLLTAPPCVMTA